MRTCRGLDPIAAVVFALLGGGIYHTSGVYALVLYLLMIGGGIAVASKRR